jgi:hypothetical protein
MRRMVSTGDWNLDQLDSPERREYLLDSTTANAFLAAATNAGNAGLIKLDWQEARGKPGYFRVRATIPVAAIVFDRLFNGRSGYRAQYYLSPEEGVLYNRQLLDKLISPVSIAYERKPLEPSFALIKRTLLAPHAKIWIFDEQSAFDDAMPNTLNPPRWIEHHATRGRKVPLPRNCIVDVKGSFLKPDSEQLFVDDLKLDRPSDLHRTGYT